MAQYKVTGPDGALYMVNGPEGASDAEVLQQVQAYQPSTEIPGAPAPKAPDLAESPRGRAMRRSAAAIGEAGLNLLTGLGIGFPAYLGGGLGTIIARDLGYTDEDPKEVAKSYSEAVTYQPRTEEGQKLSEAVNYPLAKLTEKSEEIGHKVTDATGSPVLGALAESAITMSPAIVAPAI